MSAPLTRRFVTVVFLAVTVVLASGASADYRLDPNVAPVFEQVTLDLDATRTEYAGSVTIDLVVKGSTKAFQFHAEEMTLDRVELRNDAGPIDVSVEEGEEGLRMVTCATELEKGEYTLAIDFHKEYNTNAVGLYRIQHEGKGYLFSQFQAVDARKAFPCWDEPIYKHEWQLSLTAPIQQVVVSNTPVKKQTMGATTKTHHFDRTPPMPSYLLCIAAGPLESIAITGMSVPGRVYTVKGQKHLAGLAAEYAPPLLAALEEYFGRAYPYKKLDLIAIPEYWPGAMENPGAITYRDGLLLVDPEAASVGQKRTLARVHAHEFAHMWFGDLVTMAWWDDLWLNESFADWLGDKITDQVFPDFKIAIAELESTQGTMQGDGRQTTVPVRKPVESTADMMEGLGLAYNKGKTILRMTEMWIGEDRFQEGVRNYINANAWKNTVANDLFTALSDAGEQDLTPILSTFLDQPGYPTVSVDVASGGLITLSQDRYAYAGADATPYQWNVPVRLKYSDGEQIHTRAVMLDKESMQIEVGTEVEWAMPNEGAYGYYRWSAPAHMLFHMAEDPQSTMSERERAVFLSNAKALLGSGELGGDDYLTLLGAMAVSPEPEIVSSVMSSLGTVRGAFVTDDLEYAFAEYVRASLRPALDSFGMEPSENEDEQITLVRPRLVAWLGGWGQDAEVRAQCREWAQAYMKDATSVDASLAGSALRVSAIEGDRELYDAYLKKFETTDVPADRSRYLTALGYFPGEELQAATLDMVGSGKARPQEMFGVISAVSRTEAGHDRVFQWMMDSYADIASRMPPMMMAYMPYMAGGCSEERLAVARAFFAEPEHNVDGTDRNLEKVAESIGVCVDLREREGARVADYLTRLSMAE